MKTLALEILSHQYTICRLDPDADEPKWAKGEFVSITRTSDELSVVCPQASVPSEVPSERGWRCLRVSGVLDLTMTNVIASLASILAEAAISVFVVSTFDTDYLLVKEETLEQALRSLSDAGHTLR